jgi:mono/diheme cytochrome c family protein
MKMHIVRILSLMMVGLFVSVVTAESQQGIPQGGEALYVRHCAGCHGATGDGLGPDIKELIVPPADFRSVKSRTKTDIELYLSIKQGVLFSPMHGWADRLSDQEIWDVLSYIRRLAPFNPIS